MQGRERSQVIQCPADASPKPSRLKAEPLSRLGSGGMVIMSQPRVSGTSAGGIYRANGAGTLVKPSRKISRDPSNN
jgi:hypothetical protein